MNRLFYDPNTARPYIGLRLSAHQLASVDEARLKLRQGRSAFVRDAIAAHLERLGVVQK
ncbi:ribbon-helix-helix protein, CopG family [Bradyrhizobium sp. S3.5.5]|uniref:ribbon-helix-helix protein, CopG family n=1 Tax=Bradyrhizobium sp. S3.5.5 TaxID=3156430 RepID=UPI0033946F2D